MPIVNGAYDAPTWNNNAPPAIDAAELQDMCDTIETYGTQKADVDYVNTFARPNLLDNAYFVGGGSQQGGGQFPINQRGQASYTGGRYGIDRWYSVDLASVEIQNDCICLTAGTAVYQRFIQKVENPQKFNGKTLTMSCLYKTSSSTARLVMYSPTTGTTFKSIVLPSSTDELSLASVTFEISQSAIASNAEVDYMLYPQNTGETNQDLYVVAVKLEFGPTQTLAHQENGEWVLNEIPDYQQELAKCQRYQTLLFSASSFSRVALGYAESASIVHFFIPIPTTLRISNPTIEFFNSSLSNLFVYRPASGGYNAITGATVHTGNFAGYLDIQITTTGLTTGEMVFLRTANEIVNCIANANL